MYFISFLSNFTGSGMIDTSISVFTINFLPYKPTGPASSNIPGVLLPSDHRHELKNFNPHHSPRHDHYPGDWSRYVITRMESSFEWKPFTQIYSTGVARVPTVVSGAFYYRLTFVTYVNCYYKHNFYLIIQQLLFFICIANYKIIENIDFCSWRT
jgi:hypothetical protein